MDDLLFLISYIWHWPFRGRKAILSLSNDPPGQEVVRGSARSLSEWWNDLENPTGLRVRVRDESDPATVFAELVLSREPHPLKTEDAWRLTYAGPPKHRLNRPGIPPCETPLAIIFLMVVDRIDLSSDYKTRVPCRRALWNAGRATLNSRPTDDTGAMHLQSVYRNTRLTLRERMKDRLSELGLSTDLTLPPEDPHIPEDSPELPSMPMITSTREGSGFGIFWGLVVVAIALVIAFW